MKTSVKYFSGCALDQVTWAKMANNPPNLWCHSQKKRKNFFMAD